MKSERKCEIGNLRVIGFSLKFGLIQKHEVIAFADAEILKGNPDYFWIEVSLMGEKPIEELISLIAARAREWTNGYLCPAPLRRQDMLAIFKLTYRKLLDGNIGTEVAMRATVFEFRTMDHLLIGDERGEMNVLDYSFCDGIDQEWSSIDDVKKDLLEFLKRYSED